MGGQVFFGLDAPRIQRARQGAGQSPSDAGDHVVQCGGEFGAFDFAAVFVLVKILDATVDPEVDRLREISEVSGPMGPLVLFNAHTAGMGNCHDVISL
jgi:hypothetical protein